MTTTKKKSPIAQEMARMRWSRVSAEDRTVHAKKAANARGAKYARERTEAILRIPQGIRTRLSEPPHGQGVRYSFYYTVGYEIGLAQHERAARRQMIRAVQALLRKLEREPSALDREIRLPKDREPRKQLVLASRRWKRQKDLLDMTLAALQAPPLERLVVDREKLGAPKIGSAATATLRRILADDSVIALVPSSFRPALLYGLRAGVLGETIAINEDMKPGAKLL
jgi:hypothetical protein